MEKSLLIYASKNLRSPNWQLRHRDFSQEIFQKNKNTPFSSPFMKRGKS